MNKQILYHGSRGGIEGVIRPRSLVHCDFGTGFHMGTDPEQAKTLVSNDEAPYFYKLELDLTRLPEERILRLDGLEWAYFVLFNRGRLDRVKGSDLYRNCSLLALGKDLIAGPSADGAKGVALHRYVHGEITDKTLLECIQRLDCGLQYTAKTAAACDCISILEEKELCVKELDDAVERSEQRRREGVKLINEIHRRDQHEGKYFDEILQEQSKGDHRSLP